jgi:hypothetical protein
MKTTNKAFYVLSSVILLLGLVAWTPPTAFDDVIVGNTSVTSPNTYGPNVTIGSGSSGKAASSLVIGPSHIVSADSADVARSGSIIAGASNTVDATQSLVSGWANTLNSVSTTETRNSCAIGSSNSISSPHACVIGYENDVAGDWSCAFGTWLNVSQNSVVAVGKYNEPTVAGDVFVVGAGSSDTSRDTAFKVTTDRSVILGSDTNGKVVLARSQGDISMGAYTN